MEGWCHISAGATKRLPRVNLYWCRFVWIFPPPLFHSSLQQEGLWESALTICPS